MKDKKKKLIFLIAPILLLTMALPACKNSPLEGTRWSLIEINGSELVEGTYISLAFYSDTTEGNGSCNRYSGKYTTDEPDILNIQAPGHTDMGCRKDINEQEETYFRALSNAVSYELINDSLVIYGQDNQKLLVFGKVPNYRRDPASLTGTAWQLESWNEIPVPDGLSITLTFDSRKQASGLAGIFGYRLEYTDSGDRMWGIASWRKSGELPDDLESYALSYTHRMGSANQFKLEEERLVIFTSRGDTLVYKPLENSDGVE